jgi:hypothetical protein
LTTTPHTGVTEFIKKPCCPPLATACEPCRLPAAAGRNSNEHRIPLLQETSHEENPPAPKRVQLPLKTMKIPVLALLTLSSLFLLSGCELTPEEYQASNLLLEGQKSEDKDIVHSHKIYQIIIQSYPATSAAKYAGKWEVDNAKKLDEHYRESFERSRREIQNMVEENTKEITRKLLQ